MILSIVLVIIGFLMAYYYFLLVTSKYFIKYMFQEMGYDDGYFLMSSRVKKTNMIGFPDYRTQLFYKLHNIHGKLTGFVPFYGYFKRPLYMIALKSEQVLFLPLVMKLVSIVYMFFLIGYIDDHVSTVFGLIFMIVTIITFVFMFFSYQNVNLKQKNLYSKCYLLHYLLVTDNADFWTKFVKNKHTSMFKIKLDNKHYDRKINYASNQEYVKDKSPTDYEFFKNHKTMIDKHVFHPLYPIAMSINNYYQSRTVLSGGFSLYNYVDFKRVGNYSLPRSHGMMTLADYRDIIPKDLTMRYHNEKQAYQIRYKSKTPGLNKTSSKILDRTHLVHHRLGGAEGGFGTLVPMFKSVNTGINSLFTGRASSVSVRGSMKYMEDLAFNHLSKHKRSKILYYARPYYASNTNVIPKYIHIQIYHVEPGNVYLVKQYRVFNNKYLFNSDKKFDIKIDYNTGDTYVSPK